MSNYRSIFPNPRTLLVVVHAETLEQALRNVQIAGENDADGVFLINHTISAKELVEIYKVVKGRYPDFWLGLNLLGVEYRDLLRLMPDLRCGLWTDNAGVDTDGSGPAKAFQNLRNHNLWSGLYFGSVAFKYQETTGDPAELAKLARPFVDVVTTSGVSTGKEPSVQKVRAMKQAIGDFPLAVASGMTPDNVHRYTDWVDCFLVATGVSTSHTELHPEKVARFARAIKQR